MTAAAAKSSDKPLILSDLASRLTKAVAAADGYAAAAKAASRKKVATLCMIASIEPFPFRHTIGSVVRRVRGRKERESDRGLAQRIPRK